jgi:hypothetical protein
MKDLKHIKRFNESEENLNSGTLDKSSSISDVSDSFTKKDLFDAFSHYAFASISNQPYNEEELIEEFEKWFARKYSR